MIQRLKPKSEFSLNVLTLMTGTTIAQAIPIAISPILTRIYSPEDFGVFALYIAITVIVSIIATGRYELAITLPKKDEDAVNIVALSIIITFFVSVLSFLVVFFLNAKITHLLKNQEISSWLYLVPLTVFLTGIYQSFNYWSNRKKQYKRLSISRVAQSSVTGTSNLTMGFLGFGSSGLILGGLIGQVLATTILGRLIIKEESRLFRQVKQNKMHNMAKRYIKFPKFLILAHGMNGLSSQSPIILFSGFFTLSVVGFYIMVQRVVGVPMSIVSSAIGDVFRQKASEAYAHEGNCRAVFISTFNKLLVISAIPFLIFCFVAPDLFSFVFGKNWRVAGEYAQILTPMFFLQFISSPLSSVFMIAEKQKLDLYWQIYLLTSMLLAVFVGKYIFNSVEGTLLSFSFAYSLAYLISVYMSYKFSGGNQIEI